MGPERAQSDGIALAGTVVKPSMHPNDDIFTVICMRMVE